MTFWSWWRGLTVPAGMPVTGHPAQPLEIDEQGWLSGPDVEVRPSVRHSRLTTPDERPLGVLWHYTATDSSPKALAKRILRYQEGVDRAASWHVIVAKDGVLWQSVSLRRGAWHCGKGRVGPYRVNGCLIGVELEGDGKGYPALQVAGARRLVVAIAEAYNLAGEQMRYQHRDFDPTRRSDCGEPWTSMLGAVLAGL